MDAISVVSMLIIASTSVVYMSIDTTDVDAMMSMNDQPGYGVSEFAEFTAWDDGSMDANKPFALDASLYSLDTA